MDMMTGYRSLLLNSNGLRDGSDLGLIPDVNVLSRRSRIGFHIESRLSGLGGRSLEGQ